MSTHQPGPQRTPAEVDRIMAEADGVAGSAGHRVDDEASRQILRDQIAGKISGDEARRQLLALEGL